MIACPSMNVAVDSRAGSRIVRNNNIGPRLCPLRNSSVDTVSNGRVCVNDCENEDVDPEVVAMVFWNGNLMEHIISYVPLIKDRINIEKCCRRMRDLSARSYYIKNDADFGLLDMHFQRISPEITIAISGNELHLPVVVATKRFRDEEGMSFHPPESIAKFRLFLKRFIKQIVTLRIGSIHDLQRRMGYISDYELVLTPDLCDVLEVFRNLRTLCIRNCVMTSAVLDKWTSDDAELMQRIQSFCLHGVWFDRTEDCDRLVGIFKRNVRRIHLSNCGTSILCQLAARMLRLGVKLEYLYLLLNVHSINEEHHTREALERLSQVCRELQVCICLSTLEDNKERIMLNKTLRFVTEFPKITVLEVDIGVPDSRALFHYEKLFRGLRHLSHLRTFRISSVALKNYHSDIWRQMVCGILHLENLTELSVRGIGDKQSSHLKNLCEFLPKSLKILNLYMAKNLKSEHVHLIVDRCDSLEVLLVLGCGEIASQSVVYAVEKLSRLEVIAVSCVSKISWDLVRLLCDKILTPRLDAVSMGCRNQEPFDTGMIKELCRRFHYFKKTHGFFVEERFHEKIRTTQVYRSQQGFQRIFDGMAFGECPGCEKDLTIFDEEP